jgi:hypothetical protein
MWLVDLKKPFSIVYAIYHHEFLGYLISSHAVQRYNAEELTLIHQGIFPENMSQFAEAMEEGDRELIGAAAEILPREVIRRHGGDPRKEEAFFQGRYRQEEVRKRIEGYIQQRLAFILPRLEGRLFFEMGNDSYPAQRPITVLRERATALFHFKREAQATTYYPTIKLRGELLNLRREQAALICREPAWLLAGGEAFQFEGGMDGRKLQPFLQSPNIQIPREKEEAYYQKFVASIIEKYPVKASGFDIVNVVERPAFYLQVKELDKSVLAFAPQVQYGRFRVPLEQNGSSKVLLEKTEESYVFYRIRRDAQAESKVRSVLESIKPSDSLTSWEYVEKEKGLHWLSQHLSRLRAEGIEVDQATPSYRIHLAQPEVIMQTEENGDWFDVKARVRIGPFEIPFIKFRSHILRNIREYQLPDGSVAILPEQWFIDYRHLMEVSEAQGETALRIRRYQAPLLYFPTQNNSRYRMQEAILHLEKLPQVEPPVNFQATLRHYQQLGYNWLYHMKEQGMGCILADDMGLGKTLQTLALLQKEQELGVRSPSLIVMPTSLLYNWQREAGKFAPLLRVHIHAGNSRTKDPSLFLQYDIVLTTYGIVRQDIAMLKPFPFHYVILDESQMIKNPESKTAQTIRQLLSRHRLSLTGTPIENTVMDLWSQMAFLNPGLLGSEHFFRTYYVNPIEKEKDAKQSAKLRRILYPYILRRRKHQVERDLPERVEKLHYCEMSPEQGDYYEEVRSLYRNYLLELIYTGAWKKHRLNILAGLQQLRQIAIHPKMVKPDEFDLESSGKYREVRRLLDQIIEGKRSKVLVFSQFVKMLDILREDLSARGIPFNYLDGQTRNRQAQVDDFQKNKDKQVFLISLKAGGVGLNLTAADYVFILDPWWNPAVENQAIDRSHRIGQKRTVFYYKFITENSIEEKILSLQRIKSQLSEDIITLDEDLYKALDVEDIRNLLD